MALLVEGEVKDLVSALGLDAGVVKVLADCAGLYKPGYEMNISHLPRITGCEIRANWYMLYAHGVEATGKSATGIMSAMGVETNGK